MQFDRRASAGYMANWAARLFARAIDKRLKAIGVSSGQLPVFFALGGGQTLSQKALTEVAAIEQPTMAATLSRMERDGLIARRPDPDDRRSSLVALTPEAMVKAAAVREATAEVNALALSHLGEEQRRAFLDALATVVETLDRADRTG